MLALPFALMLPLVAPQIGPGVKPAVRPQNPAIAAAAELASGPSLALIPNGTAKGTWIAGTLYEDGLLVALLKDAAGRPLYALQAKLAGTGQVKGRLAVLEYASNPALSLPDFAVAGKAEIPAQGPGTFSLVIFNPMEDGFQVYPRGQIDGILLKGLRPVVKPGQISLSSAQQLAPVVAHGRVPIRQPGIVLAEATEVAAHVLRGGVIVCPHAPGVTLGSATSMGHVAQASGVGQVSTMVVCPYESPAKLSGLSALGAAGAAGGHVLGGGSQLVVNGQTAMGSMGHAAFTAPAEGEGVVAARWYLLL